MPMSTRLETLHGRLSYRLLSRRRLRASRQGQAPAFRRGVYDQRILDLNAWLRDLAEARGLRYVDFHSAMSDEQGRAIDAYFQDGLHPTATGYRIMAGILLQALS